MDCPHPYLFHNEDHPDGVDNRNGENQAPHTHAGGQQDSRLLFSPQPDKRIPNPLFDFELPSATGSFETEAAVGFQSAPTAASPPIRPASPVPSFHSSQRASPRLSPLDGGVRHEEISPRDPSHAMAGDNDHAGNRPATVTIPSAVQATRTHISQAQLFMPYRPPPPPPVLERPLQLFQLSDFFLLRTLGTGTFGRVRLARYRNFEKFFAMKIMRKADVVRFKQEKHVLNERWLLAKLNFPFIVRLFAAFQDSTNLYLLLDYAIGGEMYSYLRKAGRFSLATTKFYAAEIFMAIEYLHGMDIAYRDLKPENILLDARGHVKLSDFGFAKIVPDRTYTLCGTPEYLAPEIIQNRGHGKAVDWWSLGVFIYEMLAGYPPYYDRTPFKTYEKILTGNLAFPSHLDAVSQDLIRRLLQPDPSLRLGNLQGGAQDIRRHPWFAGVDWNGLFRKTIMAPIQPQVQHPGDTGNFDRYEEDNNTMLGDDLGEPDPHADVFKTF